MNEKPIETIAADILEVLQFCNELKQYYALYENRDCADGASDTLDRVIERLQPVLEKTNNISIQEGKECLICGKTFQQNNGRGKKRMYCSDKCKQKATRQRALERKKQFGIIKT